MTGILKPDAAKAIERNFELTTEAWEVLALITSEFKSDPMSVQCFDLRVVEKAIALVDEHKKLKQKYYPLIGY